VAIDFCIVVPLSLKKNKEKMNKGNVILGVAALGLVAFNSTKATASTPPVPTVPVLSKDELYKNYLSAITNVFENYNRRQNAGFVIEGLDKFARKITDAGIQQKNNPKLFTALLSDYPDISIAETSLTAKQIIRNLESKLYSLYA
jgi:hypothetical protein